MQTVALGATGLRATRLGFGCAGLMARLDRQESVRLLEAAFDCGIRHFDTARAYGYGESEAALGDFLQGRRDTVTVTTKLGIVPPRRSRALATAKGAARAAARVAPVLRPLLRRGAQSMGESGAFGPAAARASLETSLRELRVDSVDILLLHELRPADASEELLDFLESAVGEGKVHSFGLATDRDSTAAILRERPRLARVVQVAHTAVDPPLAQLGAGPGVPILTHSAVAALLERLTAAMADDDLRTRWSSALGVDCGSREALARLLLAGALRANPGGVVLFSSTDPDRIRANAELDGPGRPEPAQLERFEQLVREL